MSSSTESKRPVVEDYLDEDEPISGQRYVLLSFVSPENILQKKDQYFFNRFLQNYEINWKVKGMEEFLADKVQSINRDLDATAIKFEKENQQEAADLCRKNRIRIDPILNDYQEFIRKNQKDVSETKIIDAWEDFMFKEREKLEEEFHSKNDFQTSIRGVKVRGVASNTKEAEVRAKKLQGKDKYHNIFVGEVGKWLAWDPSPSQMSNVEYAEDGLNDLMKKYKENEDNKEKYFEERKKGSAAKTVFGATDNNTIENPSTDEALFGAGEDLAVARKMKNKQDETE